MNEGEFKEILEKHGYTLKKVARYKHHDHLTVITPPDTILKAPLIIRLVLRKHLEETPTEGLLEAILGKVKTHE